MFGMKPEKMETQVRLCKARLGLQKNKHAIVVKQMRKEIADLLKTGKQDYARIRVEGVIRENLLLQAYEILSLYLELIAVRAQLIAKTKEIPRDMVEAISSIIYAAQRVSDVPELVQLRAIFTSKYSKEYAAEASSDVTCAKWQVNANLIRCLLVEPPQPEEKLQMLSEIAQEHGVEWDLSAAARELLPHGTMPNGMVVPPSANLVTPAPAPSVAQPPPPMQQMAGPGPSAGAPSMPYMDPQKAAEAAAMAAEHAKQMADWAKQVQTQYNTSQYAGTAPGPVAPPPMQQGLPPQGWLAQESGVSHSPVVPGSGGRTQEEIQKAYDAAIGPPTKGALPPSAPLGGATSQSGPSVVLPSVPPPRAPVELPSAPRKDVDPTMPQLPHPPKGLGNPEPEDEYDELSARLDALKRS